MAAVLAGGSLLAVDVASAHDPYCHGHSGYRQRQVYVAPYVSQYRAYPSFSTPYYGQRQFGGYGLGYQSLRPQISIGSYPYGGYGFGGLGGGYGYRGGSGFSLYIGR